MRGPRHAGGWRQPMASPRLPRPGHGVPTGHAPGAPDPRRTAFGPDRRDRSHSWALLQRKHARERLDAVGALYEAGVSMLVGTDAGNWGVIQGFSVHREMQRLAQAGLSTWDALAAATTLPGASWAGSWASRRATRRTWSCWTLRLSTRSRARRGSRSSSSTGRSCAGDRGRARADGFASTGALPPACGSHGRDRSCWGRHHCS